MHFDVFFIKKIKQYIDKNLEESKFRIGKCYIIFKYNFAQNKSFVQIRTGIIYKTMSNGPTSEILLFL